ncbi:putative transcription factor MYB-HB-like family [Helianthus debilis subsp. tardiflorus]
MAPKKWRTSKEEEALKAGVKEYKAGNWKDILKDPRFASILANRTNIDLKDKWRNLNGGGCVSGPPDKRIVPKYKYTTMIYEYLKYIEDPNGTDLESMMNFLKFPLVCAEGDHFFSLLRFTLVAVKALELKGYIKKLVVTCPAKFAKHASISDCGHLSTKAFEAAAY